MHLVHIGRAPAYLSDIVNGNRWSTQPRKTQIFEHFPIWTSNIEAQVRRESFSYAGPKAWNDLPLLSKNLLIHVLSKGNWKLICLHWHIHNFVEAPLVTLGVNGVWNNDNVM